ncbi:hypothetical protein COCVIDRAFT_117315, partial [Bipolaris victoriae FI3]
RDSILRDSKLHNNLLPFNVDVLRPSAVSLYIKGRILLITYNITSPLRAIILIP